MIKLVCTDLDNTLYNWVDYYVPSFLAMVNELSRLTGKSPESLKAGFRRVHQRHRTTEYSFAIQEVDVLAEFARGLSTREVLGRFDSAIKAFRQSRRNLLKVYDGVVPTLELLRAQGRLVAGITESLAFHAMSRLRQLGIEHLFDAIVSPPDHGFPSCTRPEDVRHFPEQSYRPSIPTCMVVDPQIRKPQPQYMLPLLARLGVSPAECLYIGDSLQKDVLMAQRCGVVDVFAAYGKIVLPENYSELLKITYWTDEDIQNDRLLRGLHISPSWTVESFSEVTRILDHLESPECRRDRLLR